MYFEVAFVNNRTMEERESYVYSTGNNRKITTSDSVENELLLLRSGIKRKTNSEYASCR